ncbi:hypothetical protein CAOG_07818 [Capsaspora owczarzaki ATCC 30864]|uniref:FYVE zinc finger domain-containing protein n=1 Tax=Capsaspora owczarzaki (strain ATCC 30864) TaxID=595528 RepID=A0A0D2WXZ4_CAPO3|nr:hypothetical protein CAOG_07818 [Capsaspora owczarzaki ATCC 30864]KJE97713.1 hypothetical protein CAOG_007818 [Capsaspora owczarzaki ATCC 30864]|eukprot:XP_004342891.1 hypothetical protein CAOG_07818 [Capsaspora owczarzaki ATCC 30864]
MDSTQGTAAANAATLMSPSSIHHRTAAAAAASTHTTGTSGGVMTVGSPPSTSMTGSQLSGYGNGAQPTHLTQYQSSSSSSTQQQQQQQQNHYYISPTTGSLTTVVVGAAPSVAHVLSNSPFSLNHQHSSAFNSYSNNNTHHGTGTGNGVGVGVGVGNGAAGYNGTAFKSLAHALPDGGDPSLAQQQQHQLHHQQQQHQLHGGGAGLSSPGAAQVRSPPPSAPSSNPTTPRRSLTLVGQSLSPLIMSPGSSSGANGQAAFAGVQAQSQAIQAGSSPAQSPWSIRRSSVGGRFGSASTALTASPTPRKAAIDVWSDVMVGDLAQVKLAVQQGFDVSSRDCAGRTVLHVAAAGGTTAHLDLLQYLINFVRDNPATCDLVNSQDETGQTPLHLCTAKHDIEGVLCLLHGGAVVNVFNKQQLCPLDVNPALRNIMLENIQKLPDWIPDEAAPNCQICRSAFTVINRRHHCRYCGRVVCRGSCSSRFIPILKFDMKDKVRVCCQCLPIVSLSNEHCN